MRTLYWNLWIDQYIEMNDRLCFRIMFVSLNIWVDSMVYLINRGWNLSLNKLIYDLGSNHANIFVAGWIRNDVDLKLSLLCTTMMNIERHLNKTSWNKHNIDVWWLGYDVSPKLTSYQIIKLSLYIYNDRGFDVNYKPSS